jgi:PEP-CTERM motif
MRYFKWTVLMCGIVWLCCSSTQLFGAEVVTSGYLCCFNWGGDFNSAAFELSGAGFDVTGSFENPGGGPWGPGDCPVCFPGALLPVGGSTGSDDFNGGTATIGSNYYSSIGWYNYYSLYYSAFFVSGPPILLTGPGIFRGDFSFTGFLCGFLTQADTSCDVSLPSLKGSGIVTVYVDSFVDSGVTYLTVTKAGYTFTPEPASLLLFGSGTLGLAGMLGRKLRL